MSCKRLLVRKLFLQSSLLVHWLGFWTFTAEGPGSILSWGVMIWKATKEEKENYFSPTKDSALGCLMPKGPPFPSEVGLMFPRAPISVCFRLRLSRERNPWGLGSGGPSQGCMWWLGGPDVPSFSSCSVPASLCSQQPRLTGTAEGMPPVQLTISSLSWFRQCPPLQDNWVFSKAPAEALSQIQLDRLSGCFPLSCNSQAREMVLPSPYTFEGLFSWPSPECTHPWCFFFPTRDVSLGENNWQRK